MDPGQAGREAAAAALASDVTLIINNAGIAQVGGFLAADSEDVARRMFETNFFGVLRVSKAFAPILEANGGGALLNVLSIASWKLPTVLIPRLTRSFRRELTSR